ncbi:hypothetical protein BTM148_10200 [Helicobacter pylori]
MIETATRLLTSYQIFLNQARDNSTTQINTNKTESLKAIESQKEQAKNEISGVKNRSLSKH